MSRPGLKDKGHTGIKGTLEESIDPEKEPFPQNIEDSGHSRNWTKFHPLALSCTNLLDNITLLLHCWDWSGYDYVVHWVGN